MLNRLTESLKDVFRESLLAEKWLVAPSLRAGNQWVERVARSGIPAVNVRVKTLRSIAVGLAAPEMARRSLGFLGPREGAMAAERAFVLAAEDFRREKEGYLTKLPTGPGLARILFSALEDLRLAGIPPSALAPALFEVPLKGRELVRFMERWNDVTAALGLADYAGVLAMALERLRGSPPAVAGGALLLLPEDADLHPLERKLAAALEPLFSGGVRRLPVDGPRPSPTAGGEGPRLLRAVGEVNEVRGVLRLLLDGGIPLDEAELLYTDGDTYIPLVYETFARLADPAPGKEGDDLDTMPVTFADGVPARYSRPGRALLFFLEWIRGGHRQETLASMIQDGLLLAPRGDGAARGEEEAAESFAALARTFRSLPIYAGRERTAAKIDEAIRVLEEKRRRGGKLADPEKERLERLRSLGNLAANLLAAAPDPAGESRRRTFEKALGFLEKRVRVLTRFDRLALERLTSGIGRCAACAGGCDAPGSSGALEWLAALARDTRAGGSGPRPGKLHAAHFLSGGHSGRPHTFIIGLDDGRYPGSIVEDPLFLDGERGAVSTDLPTARSRLARKEEAFRRLLAGLRGTVTFGYSCRDLDGDRETFPGPAAEGAAAPARTASFAPGAPGECLDGSEAWLRRLLSPPLPALTDNRLGRFFPWLGAGLRAAAARAGRGFTPYDGRIASLDERDDPFSPRGPVLSSAALEKLGSCPRAYFFQYILRISPPEEIEPDPNEWLDPSKRGTLLHEVFHLFLRWLIDGGEISRMREREGELAAILEKRIARYRDICPPPSDLVFEKERKELLKTARIFLHSEADYCAKTGSTPFCLEVAAGLPSGDSPSPLDDPGAIPLSLSGGRTIRVRGRIDRIDKIDRTAGGGAFAVWDYKTGSAFLYDKAFSGTEKRTLQGRLIQPGLYLHLAEFLLEKKNASDAGVLSFGYVFHGPRERGRRIVIGKADLASWKDVIESLCGVVSAGCFLATDNGIRDLDDCRFCDYGPICGDLDRVHREARGKIENESEKGLDPVREVKLHG